MEIVGSRAARFASVPATFSTPVTPHSYSRTARNVVAQPFQLITSKLTINCTIGSGKSVLSISQHNMDSVFPSYASPDCGARIGSILSFPGRPTCESHRLPVRRSAGVVTNQGMITAACVCKVANLSSRQILLRSSSSVFSKLRGQRTDMGASHSRVRAAKWVEVLVNPDGINKEILSNISILKEDYKRPFYLGNCHVETIFASFKRSVPNVTYKRELLQMPDGGTVALDWPVSGEDEELWRGEMNQDAPVLVLLPGLTGGSGDAYVRHMLVKARKAGWRVAVFNSRGCGDSPVTSPQFYSASFTEDLRQVVKHVGSLHQNSRIYASGWSLGANILVRYLGQEGESCPLAGAVSLCNPFNLVLADENFHKGFNNIYDKNLAGALGKIFAKHAALFNNIGGDFNVPLAATAKTVRDFDDGITRGKDSFQRGHLITGNHSTLSPVSFGFKTVDDYYFQSSSSRSIKEVRIPLLCIQADDDPIAPSAGIPRADIEANLNCALVVTPAGGHLGWVAGPEAPFGAPWTDSLVMDYLSLLDASLQRGKAFANSRGQSGVELVGVQTRKTSGEESSIEQPIIR